MGEQQDLIGDGIEPLVPEPEPGKYAVIVTHNRPEHLVRCMEAIQPQVDMVLIVDNASNPPVSRSMFRDEGSILLLHSPMQPPNLSLFWNMGIRTFWHAAATRRQSSWDVAILNDDAIVPPGWFMVVSDAMRRTGAVAGCSGGGGGEVVYGRDAQPAIHTRLTGWAFILNGEANLLADETFKWWAGDDDLSMQARQGGGLVVVPGLHVPNELANSTTVGPQLAQSALDMQRFVDKWGMRPW